MTVKDPDRADRDHRLQQVLADYLDSIDRGSTVSQQELRARYPDLTEELTSFFRDQQRFVQAAAPLQLLAQAADRELSLDFLDPPRHPEHLGRLGHYEVTEVLGTGGMGTVLKAFDASLNRYVAIKVLAPRWSGTAEARKRFVREAQSAAVVVHEHVVTIHAVGEANGVPYLVMEYLSGITLQQRIEQAGSLEPLEIVSIGRQIASGLAAAHAQGLIHRDIKPGNIMLESGLDRITITDFGLARAVDDTRLTQQGTIAGTPEYMAPEQALGKLLDRRADLFSLGAVLYAMATGHSPFRGTITPEVMRRVCDETPRPIRDLNPAVPVWLVEIIDRLLAKDPAERFQSAAEVAELLGSHLAQLQDPSAPPVSHPWLQRPHGTGRRRWGLRRIWSGRLVLGLSTAVLAAALISGLALRGCYTPEPGPTTDTVSSPVTTPTSATGEAYQAVVTSARFADGLFKPTPTSQPMGTGPSSTVAMSADGRSLVTITGGTAKVWPLSHISQGLPKTLQGPGQCVAAALSNEARSLATLSPDGNVRIWDLATGQVIHSLPSADTSLRCLAFSPDGKMLACGSGGGTVQIWAIPSTTKTRALRVSRTAVTTLAFSPDGVILASLTEVTGDGPVRLIKDYLQVWTTTPPARALAPDRAIFAPLSKLASGGLLPLFENHLRVNTSPRSASLRLWDVGTGKERPCLGAGEALASPMAFSADGSLFAMRGVDGSIQVWEVETGWQLQSLPRPGNPPLQALAFAPEGSLVACSADGVIHRWLTQPEASEALEPTACTKPLPAQFLLNCRDNPLALLHCRLTGVDAQKMVHQAPDGVRIRVPGDLSKRLPVGFAPNLHVEGDFEITASYRLPKPPARARAQVGIYIYNTSADKRGAAVERIIDGSGRSVYATLLALTAPDGGRDYRKSRVPSRARAGRLRLVRSGGELFMLAADEEKPFRLLCRSSFTPASIDLVRLHVGASDPANTAEALWTDLTVRAEQLPGLTETARNLEETATQLTAEYHHDFRDRHFDHRALLLSGTGVTQLVKPEPEGLRVTLPAGQREVRDIDVKARFGVRGDFEITADFEVLAAAKPRTGYGVGPVLYCLIESQQQEAHILSQRLRTNGARIATVARAKTIDEKREFDVRGFPVSLTSGRLRLSRRGTTMHYLMAAPESDEFCELQQVDCSDGDLQELKLSCTRSGANSLVDLRWKGISVRAQEISGLSGAPLPRRSWWWLPASILVIGLIGTAVWFGATRAKRTTQRQAKATRPHPDGSGQRLRARRHPRRPAQD